MSRHHVQIVVCLLLMSLVVPAVAGAAGSGDSWKPEELNWYGISQRRINDTRADSGLNLLAADGYLWSLAHERARDMAERGYLAATTPEGLDAGAYMRKDGARFDQWTEFRADASTSQPADDVAWGIIDNILNDAAGRQAIVGDFDRLGVGTASYKGRAVYVIVLGKAAAPPPPPAPKREPTIPEIIVAAGQRYGVDGNYLLRIARCESSLNPRAYNPAGPYIGLFQFLPATFYGYGGKDIYSAYDQSDIAARMISRGMARQWGCA